MGARWVLAKMTASQGQGASSMAQDLARDRTEIDLLNGAVVSTGSAYRVATPVNEALCNVLHRAADDPTVAQAFRDDPGRLAEAVWS